MPDAIRVIDDLTEITLANLPDVLHAAIDPATDSVPVVVDNVNSAASPQDLTTAGLSSLITALTIDASGKTASEVQSEIATTLLSASAGVSAEILCAASNSTLNARTIAGSYACDGTADQVQINAALAAVESAGGGTVRLASGTYNLSGAISLLSSSVNISLVGEEGVIINAASVTAGTVIYLQGTGQTQTATSGTITASITQYATAVAFSSVSGLAKNDILLFSTQEYADANPSDWTPLYARSRSYYYKGEFAEIKSISSLNVSMRRPLQDSYDSSQVKWYKLTLPYLEVSGIDLRCNRDAQVGIRIESGRNVRVANNRISGARTGPIILYYCLGGEVSNNYVTDAWYSGTTSSPLCSIASCDGVEVHGNYFMGGRSLNATGDFPCRNVRFHHNVCQSDPASVHSAIDFHGCALQCGADHNSIYGGVSASGVDINISDNYIEGPASALCRIAVEVPTGRYLRFNRNVVVGIGPTQTHFVRMDNACLDSPVTVPVIDQVEISGNLVRGNIASFLTLAAATADNGITINRLAMYGNDVQTKQYTITEGAPTGGAAVTIGHLEVVGGIYEQITSDSTQRCLQFTTTTITRALLRDVRFVNAASSYLISFGTGAGASLTTDLHVENCWLKGAGYSRLDVLGEVRCINCTFENAASRDGLQISGATMRLEGRRIINCVGPLVAAPTASIVADHVVWDALTSASAPAMTLTHNSSGNPAADFGTGLQWRGKSSSTVDQLMAEIQGAWATSTHSSRKGRLVLGAHDSTGTMREGLRVESSGAAPLVGFYGGAAVSKPTVSGSRGGNAALASLITALANMGLLTDSTS